MSSMFKKKGGLAFKPKAPVRRPGAGAAASALSASTTAQVAARPSKTPAPSRDSASAPAAASAPDKAQEATRAPTPSPSAPTETGAAASWKDARPAAPSAVSTRTRRQSTHASGTTARAAAARAVVQETAAALPPTPPSAQATTARETRRTTVAEPAQDETQPQEDEESERGRITISNLLQAGETAAATPTTASEPMTDIAATATRTRSVASAQGQTGPHKEASIADSSATSATDAPITAPRRGRPRAADKVAATTADPSAALAQDEPSSAVEPPSKKRKYTRRKPVGDTAAGAVGQESEAAPRPRATAASKKRAAPAAAAPAADGEVIASVETPAEGTPEATIATAAPKRVRRERSLTPEDAETRTVDHRELKMEDLTKDLRIGKKFSRHDELVDRLREKRRLYRRERLLSKKNQAQDGGPLSTNNSSREGSILGDEASGSNTAAAVIAGAPNGSEAAAAAASVLAAATKSLANSKLKASQTVTGPQFEIIDGAIVVNQASLVHDRHAAAAAEAGELEEVEENDFTRQTTSNTYLKPGKLRGPNAWTEAETELFYRALSMFGTSFDLICKWFPGKSRRHIKMKFNREDKLHPQRITEALVGQNKVAIDVDEYMARTGVTLHATETIDAEYALRQAEHDAEQQRIIDEQAEALRKKREALFGPRHGGTAGSNGANSGGNNGADSRITHASGGTGGGAGGDEYDIDATDMIVGGKGRRNGKAGRGRNKAPRQPAAGGFGI
ncbi:transcription factor tfiiib [Sporothrix brasiliensis 5110]|uniref:Transcription factor tfiiib n=1 Tax=Sporothrix brasiliensis 5110 TaxID=1398154 RepID=A0A0C2FB67_9PEZI|nr:transcription factor tfiiib [Sporothrix brasiliensis 5110]KIH88313.1 transcription factor tfiiib [Sporothrix brasiliensis 5110]